MPEAEARWIFGPFSGVLGRYATSPPEGESVTARRHVPRHSLAARATCALAFVLTTSAAHAQGLRGTVRDTGGRPLEGAELAIANSTARARTDSLGRYAFPRLTAGRYALSVRRITFTPLDTTVIVPTSGWGTADLVMQRLPLLAEVRARAMQDSCDPNTLDGFACRVQAGVGYYRDAAELKALNPQQFSAMFHGFPGIRPQMVRSRYGDTWQPGVRPSRCLKRLINGRPPLLDLEWWNPDDVVAVEYYDDYRKIPLAFRQFMDGFCDLVVYWLYNARQGNEPLSIAEQLAANPQRDSSALAPSAPTSSALSSSELYDAIIRVLRRSPAGDEPRFVTEGQRISVDFTGLDTALTSLGLERSPSVALIEQRYPDMSFDSVPARCAAGNADVRCRLAARTSSVRFEDPFTEARESFSFVMTVSERVGVGDDAETTSRLFDLLIERRDGTWVLMRADLLSVP